jgi:hypothetical protein
MSTTGKGFTAPGVRCLPDAEHAVAPYRPGMTRCSRLAGLTAAASAVVGCTVALAATSHYDAHSFTQSKSDGLPVSGPLSDLLAVAGGRVVVPARWTVLRAPAGRLRFQSRNNPSCRYTTTFTIATRTAPPADDPVAYVTSALPAKGPRYVLDNGRHGGAAFRVVRAGGRPTTLDALWTGQLTRRADVAPSGQAIWTNIKAHAVARTGDECHSGTWRQTLGPQLGDALATARTSLHFVKK